MTAVQIGMLLSEIWSVESQEGGLQVSSVEQMPVYELSIIARVYWQAHCLSTTGSNGSIRLLPRRQLLSNGLETDACSGNITKHYHAVLLAEYLEEAGIPLCPACMVRDGRRAAALVGRDGYQDLSIVRILQECGLCDAHGFLITAKNADANGTEARQRLSKHSLIEFSFALALPEQQAETTHLMTRIGDSKEDGQMLMKKPVRSGAYAFNVRYKSVGIGVDTDKWKVVFSDQQQRLQRHRAILSALRDQILSPSGAQTSTILPHLTRLTGAIVVRKGAGRAPLYSGLVDDFVKQLCALAGPLDLVFPFNAIDDFCAKMNLLIESSYPCWPAIHRPSSGSEAAS
jgi:CRISPR-associated autoregulator DevR family